MDRAEDGHDRGDGHDGRIEIARNREAWWELSSYQAFLCGAGDGNRTRTVSLGIGQINISDLGSPWWNAVPSGLDDPSFTPAYGPWMARR